MSLTIKPESQLETMIAEAREKEKAAKAGLMVNGQSVYTSEQHELRVKQIEAERRETVSAVTAEVQRRIVEIDEQLLPVDTDPLAMLTTDDLAKASALAPFVKEDIAAGNVAAKVRAVLRSGDKPTRAVWLRYLSGPGERGLPRWDGEVMGLVQELEAIVRPPDRRQDALRERQTELSKVVMGEAATNFLQTKYGSQVIRTGRS